MSWAWRYTKGSKLNTNTCISFRNSQSNWGERVKHQVVLSLKFFGNHVAGIEVVPITTSVFPSFFSYFPRKVVSSAPCNFAVILRELWSGSDLQSCLLLVLVEDTLIASLSKISKHARKSILATSRAASGFKDEMAHILLKRGVKNQHDPSLQGCRSAYFCNLHNYFRLHLVKCKVSSKEVQREQENVYSPAV